MINYKLFIGVFNYSTFPAFNAVLDIKVFIKGVPKKVSHSDFRVYVGQNKYYQYILNFWFDISNNYRNKIPCPT